MEISSGIMILALDLPRSTAGHFIVPCGILRKKQNTTFIYPAAGVFKKRSCAHCFRSGIDT
jgi:hypothetical protein